ncbi:MAG: hypothetical protein KME17_24505 [Cyanosarcina radialis HA8281-LM2]|jgi:hypothetical protein|nr:hypothetical protein [Cyanosarcina radialis HA8281-LM2]
MTRALLAWEIGGGQGHIQRLVALARQLEVYKIEPIFALRSFQPKGLDFPWKVLQAPLPAMKALDEPDNKSYLFTDILYVFGFSEAVTLHFHIKAWKNLIDMVKPAFIIAEFAPALVLACRGEVPIIVIGNGFTVPPPVADFPPIRESVPPTSIQRTVEVAQAVRQVIGEGDVLGHLLNGDRAFIFSIPELDPYRHVRNGFGEYVGIHNSPLPEDLGNAVGDRWGYLSPEWPHYSLVVNALNLQCDFGNLEKVLQGKSLAIHHGGATTSLACLLAGIPQIVLPTHLEQGLNGLKLERLGVARTIKQPTTELLEAAASEQPTLFQNARNQARNFSKWNHNYLDKVIEACLTTRR